MKAEKKIVFVIVTLLFLSSLTLTFNIQPTKAMDPPPIEWSKTYGVPPNATANSLVQTSDGGYALVGENSSLFKGGAPQVFTALLIKTDSSGNQLWNKNYGPLALSGDADVIQTNDGGYALACNAQTGVVGFGTFLIRTNSAGNQLWNYSSDPFFITCSVVQTSDGGLVWGGYTSPSYSPGPRYIWLNKTDSLGNQIWGKTYGNQSHAYSMVQTIDGGFALAGSQEGSGALLIKIDSAGNQIWNKTYGSFTSIGSFVQTAEGGYALSGYTLVAGSPNYYLVKTDSSGNLQWTQTYGFSISSLVQTNDGGYALAGGNMLVKTDSSGNLQWFIDFNANLACVIKTSDGGIALVGTYSGIGGTYSWLSKISPASIRLTGVSISSGGSGYTTPAVLLVGGGGTGATAVARVSQGVIFGVVLTNAGSGYTSPPTISFRDPSPRAKGASATINYASP